MIVDTSILYEVRLILLMETAPQSNIYNQVMLTQEQFKAVSDTLSKVNEHRCEDCKRGNCKIDNCNSLEIEDSVDVVLPSEFMSIQYKKENATT